MLAQLTPKERLFYVLAIATLLFVAGYIGAQHLQEPSKIEIRNGMELSRIGAGPSEGSAGSLEHPATAVVHVVGAVRRPGVVRLSGDARVEDAIEAVGGALEGADLDQLNLAAKVVDGTQIYIPRKSSGTATDRPIEDAYRGGASVGSTYSAKPAGNSSYGSRGAKSLPAPASISLNSASAAELERLPGVGPATAAKILEYRREHGGFSSIEELLAVKGIGPKKLADMRPYLKL